MACQLDELQKNIEAEQKEKEKLASELQQGCQSPEPLLRTICAERVTGGDVGRKSRTSRGRTTRSRLRFLLFSKANVSPELSPKGDSSVSVKPEEKELDCCRAENEVWHLP